MHQSAKSYKLWPTCQYCEPKKDIIANYWQCLQLRTYFQSQSMNLGWAQSLLCYKNSHIWKYGFITRSPFLRMKTSAFSTSNLWNKDNSALTKRPSITSYISSHWPKQWGWKQPNCWRDKSCNLTYIQKIHSNAQQGY